jgi:hypothetical protein
VYVVTVSLTAFNTVKTEGLWTQLVGGLHCHRRSGTARRRRREDDNCVGYLVVLTSPVNVVAPIATAAPAVILFLMKVAARTFKPLVEPNLA